MAATRKVVRARPVANTGSVLAWDVEALRFPRRAMGLLQEVASCLPFYVPRAGLLVLDWRPVFVEVCASGELGVSTGPCGVCSRPRRAFVPESTWSRSKRTLIREPWRR